jgi:hypothetical protein
MTKKLIINPENPNGVLVDMTPEEISQAERDVSKEQAEITAQANKKQEQADLKASAKAKLIAGEPLTEAEADTIVL